MAKMLDPPSSLSDGQDRIDDSLSEQVDGIGQTKLSSIKSDEWNWAIDQLSNHTCSIRETQAI